LKYFIRHQAQALHKQNRRNKTKQNRRNRRNKRNETKRNKTDETDETNETKQNNTMASISMTPQCEIILDRKDENALSLAERIQKLVDAEIYTKVNQLATKYNFDHQEAIRFLNTQPMNESTEVDVVKPIKPEPSLTKPAVAKAVKAAKPSIPLPFDPNQTVTAEQGGCQGLRSNHGLYTQCQNKLTSKDMKNDIIYCSVCLKQASKNSHGKPNAGTVTDRLACKDVMNYTAPDGKRVSSYGKVCQTLNIDQDKAVAEAYKFGIVIPDEQWVVKSKNWRKGGGIKNKTAAVTESSSESEMDENVTSVNKQKKVRKTKNHEAASTDSELIAELVRQTSTTEVPELSETCTATPVPDAPKPKKHKKTDGKATQKDTKAPKRAPSAYNLFIQDKENRAKYADVSAKEIMSKLSADWKALNETDKKVWIEKAAARKAQMAVTPNQTSTPAIAEEPVPAPAVVEEPEHVKKDLPELELEEYLETCVTDGEDTKNKENVVIETPINKDTEGIVYNENNELVGVTLGKHTYNDTEEGLVYDKNDKLVKVWDWINSDEVNGEVNGEETEDEEDEDDEDEENVVIETLIYKGVTYYKDSEGLVYDEDDTQVGVWDPATENVEFLYG
jgi:hypothetical protein